MVCIYIYIYIYMGGGLEEKRRERRFVSVYGWGLAGPGCWGGGRGVRIDFPSRVSCFEYNTIESNRVPSSLFCPSQHTHSPTSLLLGVQDWTWESCDRFCFLGVRWERGEEFR